jgi:hypothetical protein
MTGVTRKDLLTGVIAGWIVIVVIDLLVPFAGPVIGGFTAGYLAKGDPVIRAKAGVLAGLLAALVIAIAFYLKIVNTPGMGYLAGWGTGILLYFLIALYFGALAFLGSLLSSVVAK